nr:MAK10-like protein [Tanacetum cinerariifolium]
MGDANHIRPLGDYSKPSHEGYRNTIELPVGNIVVPLRFDTIRLVQNGCLFHGLRSEDPNQHLKDFLKLLDSIDLDGENRERTRQRTINQSAGGKLRDRNVKESWTLLEDPALYDNESCNNPKDFAKLVKEISLPQDVPSTSDRHLIELENQVQHLMEAPTQPAQVNKITSSCEICNGDEAKDEGNVKTSITEHKDHDMTVERKEEFEEENEDVIEEEEEDSLKHFDTFPTMKELRYHEWLLKNPRPLWVKTKVRTRNLSNIKFSCMIGHFDKKQAYLDMESPINVMSMLHYNWIMSKRLGPRRKPSNPRKICNFMRRVKGLKVFVGNFTYKCDFMVLEDTTSVIDHDLGSVIFGKPYVEVTGLVYDKDEGTITFEKDKERIVFKMPYKMEISNKMYHDLKKLYWWPNMKAEIATDMSNVKKSVVERTRHQRQYDRMVNKRQMQTQESKVDTGNDADADDTNIKPVYDEEPMAKTRVQMKDHNDSMIAQVYKKSTENVDLKSQLQEKVFAIAALKNQLRKLKGNRVDSKWIPTENLFDSCISKVGTELPHGANVDISKIHKCKQTLDLSAEKYQSVVAEKDDILETSVTGDSQLIKRQWRLNKMVQASHHNVKEVPIIDMIVMTSMIELESLFGPLFDEYFHEENQVVSKSSVITTVDASDKRQQQPDTTSSTSTLATTVTADGNFD